MFEKLLRDHEEPRKGFIEKCYFYNVREEDVKLFEEVLLRRIAKIEEVIEKHFMMIKTHIKNEKEERKERDIVKANELEEEVLRKIKIIEIEKNFLEDPDLKFDDPEVYTFHKKLEQLCNHEDALISEDKNDIDNLKRLQRICRM